MTKLAIIPKHAIAEAFPEAVEKKPYVQPQQQRDPDWLAEIKQQQQQAQSLQH